MRRWKTLLIGCVPMFIATSIAAEVYRCEQNGQVTYTDRPCAAGAQPAQLAPPAAVVQPPRDGESKMAHDYDRDAERAQKARDRADAQWLKEHDQAKAKDERVRDALMHGEAAVGMTPDQVRRALGDPLRTTHTKTRYVSEERWIYETTDGRRTVTFRDGEVVSVTTHKGRR